MSTSVPPPPHTGGENLRAAAPRNGLGTAALVCGIVAIVMSFIPVINWITWPLGVLAVIFGAIGWYRSNQGMATNRPVAITGLILGIISFFTFWLTYILIFAASAAPY